MDDAGEELAECHSTQVDVAVEDMFDVFMSTQVEGDEVEIELNDGDNVLPVTEDEVELGFTPSQDCVMVPTLKEKLETSSRNDIVLNDKSGEYGVDSKVDDKIVDILDQEVADECVISTREFRHESPASMTDAKNNQELQISADLRDTKYKARLPSSDDHNPVEIFETADMPRVCHTNCNTDSHVELGLTPSQTQSPVKFEVCPEKSHDVIEACRLNRPQILNDNVDNIELGLTPSQSQSVHVPQIPQWTDSKCSLVDKNGSFDAAPVESNCKNKLVGELNSEKLVNSDASYKSIAPMSLKNTAFASKSSTNDKCRILCQKMDGDDSVGDDVAVTTCGHFGNPYICLSACTETQSSSQTTECNGASIQNAVTTMELPSIHRKDPTACCRIANDWHNVESRVSEHVEMERTELQETEPKVSCCRNNIALSPSGWIASKNVAAERNMSCQGKKTEKMAIGSATADVVGIGAYQYACPQTESSDVGSRDAHCAQNLKSLHGATMLASLQQRMSELQQQLREKNVEIVNLKNRNKELELSGNTEKCTNFLKANTALNELGTDIIPPVASSRRMEEVLSQSTELAMNSLLNLKHCNDDTKGFWSNIQASSHRDDSDPVGGCRESDDYEFARKRKSRLVRKRSDNNTSIPAKKIAKTLRTQTIQRKLPKCPISSVGGCELGSAKSPKMCGEEALLQSSCVLNDVNVANCDNIPREIAVSLCKKSEMEIRAMKWGTVWKELESMNWSFAKGKGLDDFYYYRPGFSRKKSITFDSTFSNFKKGIPYFNNQQDVINFIVQEVKLFQQGRSINLEGFESTDFVSDSDEEGEFLLEEVSSKADLQNDVSVKNIGQVKAVLEDTSRDDQGVESTFAINKTNWIKEMETMKWSDLWSHLQNEGWSWDHGSGLVTTFYLSPGVNSKREGVLDVNMFASEDDVKRHLLQQSGAGTPQSVKTRGALTEWSLATHRQKRLHNCDNYANGAASKSSDKTSRKDIPSSNLSLRNCHMTPLSLRNEGGPVISGGKRAGCKKRGRSVSKHCKNSSGINSRNGKAMVINKPSSVDSKGCAQSKELDKGLQRNTCAAIHYAHSPENNNSSPFAKSDGSNRKGRMSHCDMLSGLKFLLTGLDSNRLYGTEEVSQKICALGGTLLTSENELYSRRSGRRVPETYLVAVPSAFRRPKFLTALAVDIPIVHPQWIFDTAAVAQKSYSSPPDPAAYVITSGSSPLHPYFIFKSLPKDNKTKKSMFDSSMRFLNLASPIWNSLLKMSGAELCPNDPDSFIRYRKMLLNSTLVSLSKDSIFRNEAFPTHIVCDSHAYCESHMPHSQVDFLHSCLSVSNSRSYQRFSRQVEVIVVTTEWLAYCLRRGEYVDPDCSATFKLPSNPTCHPLVIREDTPPNDTAEECKTIVRCGTERYVIGDIVLYEEGCRDLKSSSEKFLLNPVARIVEFFRKDRGSKISVRLQPLFRESRMLKSFATSSYKIIAASSLRGRLTVYSARAYNILCYTKVDQCIYFSSPDWEKEVIGPGKNAECTQAPRPRIDVQLSQDY